MFNSDYYYHIYNRGVEKRRVFLDKSDYQRFLLSLEEFNRLEPVGSLYDLGKRNKRNSIPNKRNSIPLKESNSSNSSAPLVDVICYCLNPNHFHLLVKQKIESGISKFIHKLSLGYTNYFNNKYSRSGALFQGKYKRKEIKTEGGLLKLSVYINCNAEIHGIDKKENWPWSSYKSFLKGNPLTRNRIPLRESDSFSFLCEQLLPEIKQIKNLEKYGLE
ncbi:MAG: transposase [Patescibacteria group bacterium]|jgi:putative transposase